LTGITISIPMCRFFDTVIDVAYSYPCIHIYTGPSVEILRVWGCRQVPVQFAVWLAYKWWCFIAHLFPGLILFSQVTAPKCTTLTHWAPLWKQILETELVNDPVPRDFSTQTDIHTWVCVWDREKLHKRYLIQPYIFLGGLKRLGFKVVIPPSETHLGPITVNLRHAIAMFQS